MYCNQQVVVLVLGLLLPTLFRCGASQQLIGYFSEHGLHGTLSFTFSEYNVSVHKDLKSANHQKWSVAVMELPVDYSDISNTRCNHLGINLMALGSISLEDNSGLQTIKDTLTLDGNTGLFGKSILLEPLDDSGQPLPHSVKVCSSLVMNDKSLQKFAVARFRSPIAGEVHFRWFGTRSKHSEMLITYELYHNAPRETYSKFSGVSEHHWKIYVSDILLENERSTDENCNKLQLVFDPDDTGEEDAIGDVDDRLGLVSIATDVRKKKIQKSLLRDEKLILLPSDLTGPHRRLYVVIFEKKHPDVFLACAQIRYQKSVTVNSVIQSGGISGSVRFRQESRFEPTFVTFDLNPTMNTTEARIVFRDSVAAYKIHELPIKPAKTVEQTAGNLCATSTGNILNPSKHAISGSATNPAGSFVSQDVYALGDLSGKLAKQNPQQSSSSGLTSMELNGTYWDIFLPLSGPHSIVHRSLVIYKNIQYKMSDEVRSEPWICGSLLLYDSTYKHEIPMTTLHAIYRYPIVGEFIFRQPKDQPWMDTVVLVEYVVHADGATLNKSSDHRWAIHEHPPGKDFYNWTARCLSAGKVYNPYQINTSNESSELCSQDHVGLCRVGDLWQQLGRIDIAGAKAESNVVSRKIFTTSTLPLSGVHSIIGKSLVIYDDFGPKARGERLACSRINTVHRKKAVAKDWFPNGDVLSVKGKIEFIQQSEFDITNVEVNYQGLVDNSGYHVHFTPVEENLEFPCESSTLYDHWNPLNVDPMSSPRAYHGTPDQYEMGDLSGKWGTLDNLTMFQTTYNDTMLPLFGPRSIIGRSIIIHKREKNRRWACATIERGYSPSEARELRAIASFHHPNGFAYGYMKMKQLAYNDGSMGDTTIEVKLRHPGKHDRNITRDHNWAIYVNPVGVDAAVTTQSTRCVAGGYVWNPFYTQLADPLNQDLYRTECGPENPLRCYVGDVSARLGTIDIGLRRKVFMDSNFPLSGEFNAIGRSIVIFNPNKGSERFACANIEPDYDIIKYVNIEKPPRFVVAQFVEEVRDIMGIPDWFLMVDSRRTRYLDHEACVQILLHFKGPLAKRLEQDFNRLLQTGSLASPSLDIIGYIDSKRKNKISYKLCGVDKNAEPKRQPLSNILSAANRPSKAINELLIFAFSIVPNFMYLYHIFMF